MSKFNFWVKSALAILILLSLSLAINFLFFQNGSKQVLAAQPTISDISPSSGLEAGGETVTITGTNFSIASPSDGDFYEVEITANLNNETVIPVHGHDFEAAISSGKIQNDCRDFRVKDIDLNDLGFWLDGDCDNDTVVWVKFSTAPSIGPNFI